VTNSRFFDQHIGHHIKSRALKTVLIGNTIEDGPRGTASYEVDIPSGGSLIMQDNTLEKGAQIGQSGLHGYPGRRERQRHPADTGNPGPG
jgi:hypothetical protein